MNNNKYFIFYFSRQLMEVEFLIKINTVSFQIIQMDIIVLLYKYSMAGVVGGQCWRVRPVWLGGARRLDGGAPAGRRAARYVEGPCLPGEGLRAGKTSWLMMSAIGGEFVLC